MGDVATWVGAIGTLGAVFWAVYLYRRSLRDSERAQARLLAPIGGVAPVQVLPGMEVEGEGSGPGDLLGISADRRPIVIAEAYMATVRLVSTSDEAFSGTTAALLMEDGREADLALGFDEIAPHEEKKFTNYFPPGDIAGSMRVRLRFRDANGRRWERVNGEPLRPYSDTKKKTWSKRATVAATLVTAALGIIAFLTPEEMKLSLVGAYAFVALGFGAVKAATTIFNHDSSYSSGTKLRTTLAICDVYAFIFAISATVLGAFTLVPAFIS